MTNNNPVLDVGANLRARSPEATLAHITPLLFERFGITRLANITGLDKIGIPVVAAIRPNGKCLSVSQGKGLTLTLAKISAIMESLESWHAENIPAEAIIVNGSFAKLQHHYPVISPIIFQPEAEAIEQVDFDWLQVKELLQGQTVLLPRNLFSLDTTVVPSSVDAGFQVSSNGLAAGNTLDEAICQSLFELIERDAMAQWYELTEEEQDQYLIALDSVEGGIARQVVQQIHQAGLELYVWQVVVPNGIPTFYAVLTGTRTAPITLFSGSGSHFDTEVAFCRAVTEAAQARLTYISGSRDDIFPDYYQEFDPSEVAISLKELHPSYSFVKTRVDFASFAEMKVALISQLKASGVQQLFCYEHTRPDWDIPVVHILSPDLQKGDA